MDVEYFAYKLRSPRSGFPGDMTAAEAETMARHADYWQGLVADGTAVAFGPVFEPEVTWGLAIVESGDAEAVRAIGAADPAVRSGLTTFEIHPMPGTSARPHVAAASPLPG